MQVQCGSCEHIAQLDETKVPEGVFKIRCPKCGKIITAEGKRPAEQIPEAIREFLKLELSALKETMAKNYYVPDAGSPVASPPVMAGGPKRALVCEPDPATSESVSAMLRQSGYSVEAVRSIADAIKKIDNQQYRVITVAYAFPEDKEGGKKIIAKINGKKPAERRKTFLALLSNSVKTADINVAFFEGANITVNKADLASLPALMLEAQQDLLETYRIFDAVTREKEEKL